MKGLRTILIGAAMAVLPTATQYFGAIDWNNFLPAPWGMVVGGLVMIAMRFVTSSPVFEKE